MTLHWSDSRTEVHRLVVGPMDNNVFVIRCRESGEAVLLDAANEHERLLELCQALDVRTVLETHGHWDHIQAVPAIRDAGYRVGITAEDAEMLPSYDYLLEDQSVIDIGRLRIHTHHTPGHTPGSMSFSVEGTPLLFTGDTLFPKTGCSACSTPTPWCSRATATTPPSVPRRLRSTNGLPGAGDDRAATQPSMHIASNASSSATVTRAHDRRSNSRMPLQPSDRSMPSARTRTPMS